MQNRVTNRYFKFDWLTILIYFLLVGFGWLNILSASYPAETFSLLNLDEPYGKQLLFIGLSLFIIIPILALDVKFYERFASIIYVISIISLLGLFVFGKNINGATSWYNVGGITIQPSEFSKFAVALAIAKYLSDFGVTIKQPSYLLKAIIILAIPAFLILLQNDAGSTIVYAAFFYVLYREGLPKYYLNIASLVIITSVLALKISPLLAVITIGVILILRYFMLTKRPKKRYLFLTLISTVLIAYGARFFYNSVLKAHQQDRISLWLRLEDNPERIAEMRKNILYNLYESEKAIRSGGFTGKGFLEGTRTTGRFVPQQHTDYIFSTVGEEWGFIGSTLVVLLFCILCIRIVKLADRQKNTFSRIYGYSVASILFFHFMINTGMVMGLIPTIGIPLPFFSYGGSALLAFTILLFVFIKLDSNRINEW